MIVFVGSMYLEDETEWFRKYAKTSLAISSDTHQKAIISGLSEHERVFVVNRPPCGYSPKKFSKINIETKKGPDYISMGWTNLLIVRDIQYIFSTARILWELCKKQEVHMIVGYMPFLVRVLPLVMNKLLFKKIPLTIIVPDLPQHSYPKNRLAKMIRSIRIVEGKMVNALSKHVDSYVYLTEEMHEILGKNCNYLVQEAIYQPIEQVFPETSLMREMRDCFTYLYCGKISEENGLKRLIQGFMELDYVDVRLLVCGDGDLLGELKKMAEKDSRIVFTGQLSHEVMLSLEQHATVLVNPRYTGRENTAYSFPSKLIEYMATGRPVMTSRLEGIPEDYDPYVLYLKDNSAESVTDTMQKVYQMNRTSLEAFGQAGKSFVEKYKSSKTQGKKLYDHLVQTRKSLENLLDEKNGK